MESEKHILSYHFVSTIQTHNESDKLVGLKITFASMKRTKNTKLITFRFKEKKYFS